MDFGYAAMAAHDATFQHYIDTFRRAHRQGREPPWRSITPNQVGKIKQHFEDRAVARARRKPQDEAHRAKLEADLVDGLRKIKRSYVTLNPFAITNQCESLKNVTRALRVALRASDHKGALPPRVSQFTRSVVLDANEALAWVNAMDNWMLAEGRDPGPPLDTWGRNFAPTPLDPKTAAHEQAEAHELKEKHSEVELHERYSKLLKELQQGLRRAHMANKETYKKLTKEIRIVLIAIGAKAEDLPVHPDQATHAGNFEERNERAWIESLEEWVADQQEPPPPEYRPPSTPPYAPRD